MAISVERATEHAKEWTTALARFPSRANWGSALFHACQIETATEILRQGKIVCRRDVPVIICDVANQGALWNNPAAHEYVRLYFRPRNRFHLKTEGIKSSTDIYRVNPHMSIPIMFVFDFVSVMALESTRFVSGNFASLAAIPQQGNSNFNLLNFDHIYHDSAVSADMMQTIQDARMAEVVVSEELSLDHLRAVVCRTVHEESMLRYMLREYDIKKYRMTVEKGGSIFFRRGIYINEVYTQQGYLHFDFTSPSVSPRERYSVSVKCGSARYDFNLAPTRWRVPQINNHDPAAVWRIEIEGCLAFEGPVPATNMPIVA
jgi:hypothetical protein